MKRYSGLLIAFVAVFFLASCASPKPRIAGNKKNNNNNGANERDEELLEENQELKRELELANFNRGLQTNPNAFGHSPLRPEDVEAAQRAGAFRDANGQLSTIGARGNFQNPGLVVSGPVNQVAANSPVTQPVNNGTPEDLQESDFEALPALEDGKEVKRAFTRIPSSHSGGGVPVRRRRVE